MTILTTFSDVSDIIILEVEDPLGVLNDGGSVRGDKVLDGLGHPIFSHESSGLRSSDLGSSRVGPVLAQGDVEKAAKLGVVGYLSASMSL